jgi:outer membrane translocation and assembly module TamA
MLGLRARIGTSFTDEDPAALPAAWRHHLGGAADLRGFSRLALPRDRRGALSRATLGIELRPASPVPTLQPLAFIDAGMLGSEEASLDGSPYWSAGGGLAWESPVGPLRTTLANGWAGSDDEGLQFFLSWGRTF